MPRRRRACRVVPALDVDVGIAHVERGRGVGPKLLQNMEGDGRRRLGRIGVYAPLDHGEAVRSKIALD